VETPLPEATTSGEAKDQRGNAEKETVESKQLNFRKRVKNCSLPACMCTPSQHDPFLLGRAYQLARMVTESRYDVGALAFNLMHNVAVRKLVFSTSTTREWNYRSPEHDRMACVSPPKMINFRPF
jgi:hypothetical protein